MQASQYVSGCEIVCQLPLRVVWHSMLSPFADVACNVYWQNCTYNMKVSARAEPLLRSPVIDESSCVFARVYLDFLTGEDGRNVRG